MRELTTAAEVIDALGGVQATATMFGRSHNCVYDWRTVGQFPPATYLAIKRALKRQGLAADLSLWRWDAPAAGPPWESERRRHEKGPAVRPGQ